MSNVRPTENVVPLPQLDSKLLMGKILERAGKLSADEVHLTLRYQQEHRLRFGEAAMGLGLISNEDVCYALSQQFRFPQLPIEASSFAPELIAATDSRSAEAEALRAIRAQLNLRWFKGGRKRLAIAGINAGDGASTLIANLAISFAQLGKRTLIVDANLRRPSQDRIFNLMNVAGLSDILAERAGVDALVRVEPFEELTILPAGTIPPNPTELISGPAFEQLLDTLATRFDVIFCDAPAFMSAADAVSIASATGGVMFVARKNKTSLNDARGANQLLIGTDIPVVGSILLDF
jgi:protein-tyrosine kinase